MSKTDLGSDRSVCLDFICIVCCTVLRQDVSTAVSNLTHQLKRHNRLNDKKMEKWLTAFDSYNDNEDKPSIYSNTLNLVKNFMSTNAAYNEIQNKYLRAILKEAKIKVPCISSFKDTILPEVAKKLRFLIVEKLRQSMVIISIVDIWSTSQMAGFMGLAAMLCKRNFEKECYVIGMERMPGSHNAENFSIHN